MTDDHDTHEIVPHGQTPALFSGLDPDAIDFARASKARSTVRAYDKSWRLFLGWCRDRREKALPASSSTVSNYLAHRASSGSKVSTISVDLAAIRQAHLLAAHPSPSADAQVIAVMGGIRRSVGTRPKQKDALLADALVRYCADLPDTAQAVRDRAMLLVGFCGAFRRSELVAIQVEHLTFHPGLVVVLMPSSKTDQERRGLEKTIHATGTPTCPITALRAWLDRSKITTGYVFRGIGRRKGGMLSDTPLVPEAVALLVKRVATHCGLPVDRLSGHSVRAGFATAAAEAGVPLKDIMDMTHHASTDMVMKYIRTAEQRRARTTTKLGL